MAKQNCNTGLFGKKFSSGGAILRWRENILAGRGIKGFKLGPPRVARTR